MPSIWQKEINTPFSRLLGVLFFMGLLQIISLEFKTALLLCLLLLSLCIAKVSVKKLLLSWYRFKYLLLSIVILNFYFLQSIGLSLDKLCLLLCMLSLVSLYMQFEKPLDLIAAFEKILIPLNFFGFNNIKIAQLFKATLQAVEEMKFSLKDSDQNTHAAKISFNALASRLTILIRNIERPILEKQSPS